MQGSTHYPRMSLQWATSCSELTKRGFFMVLVKGLPTHQKTKTLIVDCECLWHSLCQWCWRCLTNAAVRHGEMNRSHEGIDMEALTWRHWYEVSWPSSGLWEVVSNSGRNENTKQNKKKANTRNELKVWFGGQGKTQSQPSLNKGG